MFTGIEYWLLLLQHWYYMSDSEGSIFQIPDYRKRRDPSGLQNISRSEQNSWLVVPLTSQVGEKSGDISLELDRGIIHQNRLSSFLELQRFFSVEGRGIHTDYLQ